MPQLINFAVCEKCLITGEGTASLIVLMQKTIVEVAPDSPKKTIPANAVGPMNWCVYSLWTASPGEGGVEFTEVIEILWPDKTEFKKHSVKFRFKEKENHNVLINILGFPIGQTGKVVINMWLELDSKCIGDVHSWAIEVEQKRSE